MHGRSPFLLEQTITASSYLLIAKIVKMHNGLHRYVSLVETIEKHVWIVSFVVPLIMYGLPKVPTMDSLNFSCSQTGAAALHALSEFHSSSNRTNNYGTSRTCSAGFVALRHARHRCCRSRAKFLLNVGSKRELREAIKLPRVDAGGIIFLLKFLTIFMSTNDFDKFDLEHQTILPRSFNISHFALYLRTFFL